MTHGSFRSLELQVGGTLWSIAVTTPPSAASTEVGWMYLTFAGIVVPTLRNASFIRSCAYWARTQPQSRSALTATRMVGRACVVTLGRLAKALHLGSAEEGTKPSRAQSFSTSTTLQK